MAIMQKRQSLGKWCAAMCAAPIALARYGLLDGHDYTCYPGIEKETQQLAPNGHFKEELTVTDQASHLVTSRGPATA
ncbi:DJ-1/PfpI family protein, partial [Parabacteroides merdae]|uniref:DJ-1/PfpI family protein n=1 Tax=Parabacteroides merdae TaxID=46503 RepID=UPI00374DBA22